MYKSEKFDPYWMPSKILFLNWFLMTSWIIGLVFMLIDSIFIENINIFLSLGATLIFTGFITGYLSCLTDIGDHPPAGIKWGVFNGLYMSLGFLILNTFLPNLNIFLNILNLVTLFIFAMLLSGFFGIIGRFHHEININLRMEKYYHIKRPWIPFVFSTILAFIILYYLTILALIQPTFDQETLGYLLAPNLWHLIKLAYVILVIFYFIIYIFLIIDLIKNDFFKKYTKLDKGSKIIITFTLIFPLISIILIISILPQILSLTDVDSMGNMIIGQGVWNTSYGVMLVNYIGILIVLLKLTYEIEIIDFKLYNRAK